MIRTPGATDGSHGGPLHFDAAKSANRHTGHTDGSALTDEDRWDLEYPKSR